MRSKDTRSLPCTELEENDGEVDQLKERPVSDIRNSGVILCPETVLC